MTQITVKIKPAAKWSDGTPVTAEDVAYTWASNLKYETSAGNGYKSFIASVEAVDDHTVLFTAVTDADGKNVNPLQMPAYLSYAYVIQKAWTQTLEARSADAAAFKAEAISRIAKLRHLHSNRLQLNNIFVTAKSLFQKTRLWAIVVSEN